MTANLPSCAASQFAQDSSFQGSYPPYPPLGCDGPCERGAAARTTRRIWGTCESGEPDARGPQTRQVFSFARLPRSPGTCPVHRVDRPHGVAPRSRLWPAATRIAGPSEVPCPAAERGGFARSGPTASRRWIPVHTRLGVPAARGSGVICATVTSSIARPDSAGRTGSSRRRRSRSATGRRQLERRRSLRTKL